MLAPVLQWPSAGAGAGDQGLDRRSAGSVLRAQGSSGEGGAFALCARGRVDRFQCMLRPVPAAASGPRGSVPHIYTKGATLTYFQVMRDRLRMGWFWCVFGSCSAGSVLRAQGSSGEDGAFAQRARERFDRFQCLLLPGPAAASRLSGGSENLGTGSQKVNRGLD